MAITSGSRIGPYEVIAPLGSGGMGEVWKARDTRLERSVAIKVLPAEFADDAQLKLRFEREARTISQLNHPHICTLYDVGDGYLVMELLEGESLADRLVKGPLPLDQVVRYGAQIAEALDKAHKAGVVHRDLKPGNVMITKSGAKLLDFGLAKPHSVFEADGATQHKPLTQEGSIVGTFQYMAPEQIEGGAVDSRTDIFALGAVLYEMATGRRAFDGKSKASLIASILTAEPQPIRAIQPMTPTTFDRVVRTCLKKDPDDRWQSAHDVATELRWIADSPEAEALVPAKRSWIAWGVAAAFVIASAVLGLIVWRDVVSRRDAQPIRTAILPPEKMTFDFVSLGAAPPAISPDGRKIVFGAADANGTRTLWIRDLDFLVPYQLATTTGAMYPFWSPDGRHIGFFADNALKKMEVSGGGAVFLCPIVDGRGGSWSHDGQNILFAGRYTTIMRIPAAGGTPVPATKMDGSTTTHRWPEFLPDARHFLYLASPSGPEDPANRICVGSIDGSGNKTLITNADDPHYLNGAILFVRDHILIAQAFDPKTLTIKGDPVPLKEQQIEVGTIYSKAMISVSPTGSLLYQMGSITRDSQPTWYDRTGKILGTVGQPAPYSDVAISPDGKFALVTSFPKPQSNVWMFDLTRGVKTRITFGNGTDGMAIWSPDQRRIAYSSYGTKRTTIAVRELATGAEKLLVDERTAGLPAIVPTDWSSDGQRFLYTLAGRETRSDIWTMSIQDLKPVPYLQTSFVETHARFSPDGKWIAYASNESGQNEIYLAPFPPTGAKWQVSTAVGSVPRWRADGRELFFVQRISKIMSVPITLGAVPQIGQPVALFDIRVPSPRPGMYDVTRDGQRFLVNTRVGEDMPPQPLILMQHFDNELRAALEHHD